MLDKALLRPGRFDRRITVDRPNLAGRLATLQVHTRNIRLSDDVNLEKIAAATAGCVGADLANLVNEAALRAVRMGRKAVNQNDLLASFEMVIAGAEKKGTVLTEKEKKLIAYHEVGHALVAARQKGTQPVSKITIVPHTQGALGYTMQTPEEEKYLEDKGGAAGGYAHAAGRPGRRVDGVPHHDHRRLQRHRAGHRPGPEDGHHVWHERPLRSHGAGHHPEPLSGRHRRHELRRGHRRPGGRGGPAADGRRLSGRHPHSAGQPGDAGQGCRLSAGEGDHHRSGDDGHSGGRDPALVDNYGATPGAPEAPPHRRCGAPRPGPST